MSSPVLPCGSCSKDAGCMCRANFQKGPSSLSQEAAKGLQERLGDQAAVVLLASPGPDEGKVAIAVALSAGAVGKGLKAGALAGTLAKLCGGGGGGRPNLATAGGKDPAGVPAALEAARAELLAGL